MFEDRVPTFIVQVQSSGIRRVVYLCAPNKLGEKTLVAFSTFWLISFHLALFNFFTLGICSVNNPELMTPPVRSLETAIPEAGKYDLHTAYHYSKSNLKSLFHHWNALIRFNYLIFIICM